MSPLRPSPVGAIALSATAKQAANSRDVDEHHDLIRRCSPSCEEETDAGSMSATA